MSVHVCTGLWAGTLRGMGGHTCVCAIRGQLQLSFLGSHPPCFLRQGVSLGHGIRLGEASEQVRRCACLGLPRLWGDVCVTLCICVLCASEWSQVDMRGLLWPLFTLFY